MANDKTTRGYGVAGKISNGGGSKGGGGSKASFIKSGANVKNSTKGSGQSTRKPGEVKYANANGQPEEQKSNGLWQSVKDFFGTGNQEAPQQEQPSSRFSDEANSEGSEQGKERNFLAEATEGTVGKPGSEKSKAVKPSVEQPKTGAGKQSEEDADMDAGWAKLEQQDAEKQAHKENYENFQKQIEELQREGQNRSQIWVDGIYMGEDKQIADSYAKRIADLQEKAEKERQAAGDAIGLNTGEAIGANLEHGTWHGIMGIGQAGAAEIGKGISSEDSNSFFGRSAAANQGKLNQEYGEQLKNIWNGGGSVGGKLKDTLFSTYHFGMQSMEKGAARNDAIYVGQNAMNYLLRKWALPNITGSDDADANAAWLTGKAYDATDKLTDKVSEWEPMKYINDENLQSAMKSSSGGAKLAGQVSDVIGRMLPSMAVSWATKNPDAGRLIMAQSAGGAAAAEAYRNGATAEQAYYIGREKGFIEWLSEGLFEGIGLLGGGVLSDGMKKVLGDFALTKLGRVLTKAGDILGENAEEAVSDWADPGVDKAVLGQLPEGEEDLSMIQALLGQAPWTEQGLITLMSTLVLGGISDVSQNGMHRVNQEQAQEILTIAQNSGNERLASLAAEYADLIEKRGSMGAKQFSEFAEATKQRIGEEEFNRKLQEQRQKAENPGPSNMAMFSDPATGLSADQLTLAKTPDSAAMDGMKTNAAAWLSAKLSGAETGESILGNYTDPAFIEDLPDGAKQAAQAFASTEGAEAAVQNIMNYIAEIAAQNQGEWDDAKSNAAAGYVLGTLSNLFQGGEEVDQKRQQSIAEEAAEFARRGLTIDEAIAEAQQTAQKSITAKPAVVQAIQPAQDSTGTAWTGDWNSWVEAALSGGALSDEDIDTIYSRPKARQAFEELKNESLDGLSEEEAKSRIGMAAGTMTKVVEKEQAQETPTEAEKSDPVREWVNSRQEAQNAAEGGLNSTESKSSKKPSKVDKNLEKLVLDRLKQKAKDGTLKRGTVSFDGGELNGQKVDGVDQNNLTKQQKSAVKAAEAVATALGLDIVFFSDKAKDGNIKLGAWQGDKLYLNLDGAIRANKNGQSISRFIVGATLSHELTHYLQKYDEAGYAELRDFVEKTILKKDAGSLERMIQQQIAMDPSLSPDEAMDEVVANACQGMLYDNKIVQQLARQNMSLVEKIIDIFDSVGNRLKGAFAEVNLDDSDIYRAARLMKGDMAELRNIWNRDLLTATENFQNQQGQEKTAQEGGEKELQQFQNDSPVKNDIEILTKIKDKDGEAQFQVAAFENDEPEYRSMLAQAGWKESDIDTLFEKVNKAVEVIKDNQEALDYAWDADIDDRAFNPVKQNSDKLYKVSQDFSTLCRKRILQGVIAGELSDALQRGLTKEEGIAVRDALMALQKEGKQIEVACALCYVESARMRSQKAIQEFLNNREASIRNYFAGKKGKEAESAAETAERNAIYEELGMIRGKGDDATMYDVRDSKTATMKVLPTNIKKRIQEAKKKARASYPLTDEQQRLVDEANKLPVTAFTTPEGLQELAKNPDTRDIFNAFVLKVSAASKSKGIENDTWWRAGDSKSISDLLIEQMNAENGLRTQSWSDFQVKHLMDYIAATIELSTRQAKQHAYTKVLDYVELMGDTGVMINMSLIPTADYNGKLEFDDVEGFKYKEAMRMRNKFPDTAGTICIGMDNDQIHQLLESDEIDYVIPYHQSGMSKATRAAMHIPAWKDFQSFQGEKKLSGDAAAENAAKYGVKLLDESDKKWHEGPAFSEWFDLEKARETATKYGKSGKYGVMTGGYMAMQEAAENYKRICAERGLQPKFSYGKADFSEDANYWKLLIDRKMVNNKTGEIIEQKAIQPNFSMDTIQRILDDELERYGNVKADQEEAIQRVTEAVMSGKVKGGMSSEEIAEAMQKPIDNLAITAATQGQTYNPDIFDPVETLTEKPKQTGTKKTQTAKPQDTAGILAETATGKTGKKGTKLNWNDRSSGKEKTSEYYSNTATKNGKAKELDETNFKYVPISEQKSIRRAATKVANNYDEVLADLYGNRTWLSEQVDAAWLISDKLHNEAVATGTKEAWDAYNKFEELIQDHATEAGAALQAFAKQSRPGSAAVMRAAQARINAIREAKAEAEKAGKTKGLISEEALKKAEEKTREYATRMGKLEYEIDQKIKGGMSEETARNEAKEAYLDLIDEINTFRHTGLIQDAGKQANAREAAKANKEVQKLNTKFRKMLEKEDMEYIMRFAATDMAGISADTQYDGKQDFRKRLNTWQKLAQLTGTGTWLRNGVGNGSFGIVDVLAADNPVTILADALLSAKTGKRSSGFETGILNKVARDAAAHSLRRSILEVAANIDIDADSDTTKYDMSTTRTYDPDSEHLLTRIGSRWEQWNGYMLQSSDAWFKGMAKGSAEAAIRKANRWDKGNLTKAERASMDKEQAEKLSKKRQAEIDETVRQIAEYRTFQNDSMLSKGADKFREGLNKFGAGLLGRKWQQGQFGLGTALMPYTKVPTNLAMKAVEFSPAGALNGLREMIQVMNDPKATMAQQQKAVTDFGRGVTGTALVAVMASLMKQFKFFKDWDDEDDPDVRAQNRAEGKYGMQFNLDMIKRWANGDKNPTWENDDRTLDISSMEPLNQLIGAASLLADDEKITAGGILEAFTKAAHDSLNNMPALQTLANIENTIRYTDTPDDAWQTFVTTAASTAGNVAGGMIPAPIKHYAALRDENVRDTSGKNAGERAKNQVKSAIPGLRKTLPVKRDAFGNEMKAGDFATRFANQYDAFKHTQVNQSEVSRELEKVREDTDEVLVPSRNPVKKIKYPDGTLTFSNKDAKDYQAIVGKEQELRLSELFDSDLYKNSTPALKAQMIREVESYAKDTGKTALAEAYDIDFDSEYSDVRKMNDPVSFLMTKTGFNAVKKAEKWDSVDALLQSVRSEKLTDNDLDYYEEHMQGFKKLYAMAGSGLGSKRVIEFGNAVKALYESEARSAARGSDYIRVAGSGKFTDEEADIFMSYAPEVSQKQIDNYHNQVNYQLNNAGLTGYDTVWSNVERVANGSLSRDAFKSWMRNKSGVPRKQAEEIINICKNYTTDRHEAGKRTNEIYTAVRKSGGSAQDALKFWNSIDRDYNGYFKRAELEAAVKRNFTGAQRQQVWNQLKRMGYVKGNLR